MDVIADDLFPGISDIKKKLILQKSCIYDGKVLLETKDNLLYPDVKETLRILSEKHHLFIVSNCQSGYIELLMQKAGIEKYITDHECFGNTGKGKGENIKIIMERNNLDETVYVGDTQIDYEAASYAGIPFIYARYGFGTVENCYMSIDGIKDLLKLSTLTSFPS